MPPCRVKPHARTRVSGFARLVFCACVLIVSSSAHSQDQKALRARGDQHDQYDRWYELWLAGSQSGFVHETRTLEDGQIHSRSTTQMSLKRGATTITISTKSEFVETLAGEPRWISVLQTMGDDPVLIKYVFEDKGVRVVRTAQGLSRSNT